MNTDQHPALFTKHYDPPSLTLVLPGDLDNDQVLKGGPVSDVSGVAIAIRRVLASTHSPA